VKYAISILGAPLALAAIANLLTFGWLELVSDGRGLDGAQMLLRVAGGAAVVSAVAVFWHDARANGSWGLGALLGVYVGIFTFLLSWVPALVLLALYPPT
jgi:hypothetical protein